MLSQKSRVARPVGLYLTNNHIFAILFLAMPITSSAKKKARQDVVSRERNRIVRDDYKKASKEVRKLVAAGEAKKAKEALIKAFSKIDIAAKKKILHKNNASRRKSRLSLLIKSAGKTKTETVKPKAKKETK